MSIPRMDMRGPARRYAGMQGATPAPRSTMGMEQPFGEDDLAAALGAMMGVPVPQGGGSGMNAGMMQALRARMQGPEAKTAGAPAARPAYNSMLDAGKGAPGGYMPPAPGAPPAPRGPTGTMIGQAPLDTPQPAGWFAPASAMRGGGTQIQQPTPDMIKTVPPPMRGMQRTPVPPPGMSATGAMDDLAPLAPMHPEAAASMKAGIKYQGPDAADLARRYDDEWWANHAANPPPKMRPGPEEPLPPLPPPDPEFMQALLASRAKTVPPPGRGGGGMQPTEALFSKRGPPSAIHQWLPRSEAETDPGNMLGNNFQGGAFNRELAQDGGMMPLGLRSPMTRSWWR